MSMILRSTVRNLCSFVTKTNLITATPSSSSQNRALSFAVTRLQKSVEEVKKSEEPPKQPEVESLNLNHAYKPDNLEKRMLVWTGKYKTVDEIPAMISREEMEKSRSKVRIRVSNILMVLTLIGCIFMVRSGKKAAEKGETVQKMNQDWHKQYNEVTNKEAAK